MQRLKQLADKKHVPLEKTTSKLADGGNKICYTVQTPYEGTLAGMTIFNFEDGTRYTKLVDNGLLYSSSLNPWEFQENKRFDSIFCNRHPL